MLWGDRLAYYNYIMYCIIYKTYYARPYASNLLLVVYLYSVVAVCTFVFLNLVFFFNDCYRTFNE